MDFNNTTAGCHELPCAAASPPEHTPSMHATTSWSALPHDFLLQHVVQALSPQQASTLRLVNREAEALVNLTITTLTLDPTAATRVDIPAKFPRVRTLRLQDSRDRLLSDDLLVLLASACPYPALAALDLRACPHIAAPGLRAALAAYPTTSSLILPTWTDDLMLTATRSLTGLVDLDLGHPRHVIRMLSDAGLATVASSHLHLTSLSLARCSSITDAGVASLSARPTLCRLDLSRTSTSTPGLTPLAPTLTALHTLLLNACRKVSDDALEPISRLPSLTRLELDQTPLTPSALAPLRPLRLLAHLVLGSRFTLTLPSLLHLSPLTSLTHLTFGTLCLTPPGPPPPAPAPAPTHPLPTLLSLQFGGMHRNRGVHHFLPLPLLHTLSLWGLETAADSVLAHAALHPALTALHLSGGYQVTGAGLRQLAAAPKLQRVVLGACPQVTVEALQALCAEAPCLEELEVWQCPRLPVCPVALAGSLPSLTSVKCTC